jgi:hypothetical protein
MRITAPPLGRRRGEAGFEKERDRLDANGRQRGHFRATGAPLQVQQVSNR